MEESKVVVGSFRSRTLGELVVDQWRQAAGIKPDEPFDARAARKLVERCKTSHESIVPIMVANALSRIELTARSGGNSIYDPCGGSPSRVTPDQRKAAYQELERLGFLVFKEIGDDCEKTERNYLVSW
jgi:hypothetical protein